MIRLNIHEAKTHLSRYLERVERGETILLCRHNRPVAEIRPLAPALGNSRALGIDKGKFTVPPAFFEELPAELRDGFRGE